MQYYWPLGLVNSVDVVDGGLLHLETDDVYINGPGRIDPRSPALASLIENYDDQLVQQAQRSCALRRTSIYFNKALPIESTLVF